MNAILSNVIRQSIVIEGVFKCLNEQKKTAIFVLLSRMTAVVNSSTLTQKKVYVSRT